MSYEKLKIDVEYPAELLQKLKSLSDKQEAELRMLFRMDEEKHIVNTFHRLDKKQEIEEGVCRYQNNLMALRRYFDF